MSETSVYSLKLKRVLVKIFLIALNLTNEDEIEVVSRLISQYIINSFISELKLIKKDPKGINTDVNLGKELSRIPKWALKPSQKNHKILKAYFLSKENGIAKKERKQQFCSKEIQTELYVKNFNDNFNSMCTDGGKSHGKAFEVNRNGGSVSLWDEIKQTAINIDTHLFKFLLYLRCEQRIELLLCNSVH